MFSAAARVSQRCGVVVTTTSPALRLGGISLTTTTRSMSSKKSKPVLPLDLRLNKLPPTGTMTKVVCTIGPSTDQADKIQGLMEHGMHVARLNFSHAGSDYTYPESILELVRTTRGKHSQLSTVSDDHQAQNLRAILVGT
jgi:hypothetical protein